jgi:hypothetical protein
LLANDKTFVNISILTFVVLGISGCYYDVEEELYPDNKTACDTTTLNFAAIKPIFDSKCTGCHGGASPSAGIKLDTYLDTKAYLDEAAATLVSSVKRDGNASNMPQGSRSLNLATLVKFQLG